MSAASIAPLVFEGVSHWYGDVVAVNDVSAVVEPGITGLLGPNGAGKSTLLQLAAGVQAPSSGRVKVFGESPMGRPSVFARLGIVPEREALPPTLSARAFVEARATLLGMHDVRAAAATALATVELDEVADRAVEGFSKGMRQRVKLAAAMVHEPDVLLLDEPFNGLDPRQRAHMMQLLEHRAAAGTTILLSSHILEEIEGVASRMLVMVAGRLAASGDHRTLRRLMTDRPHTVRIRASDPRMLASVLVTLPDVIGVEIHGTQVLVRTADHAVLARQLVRAAQVCNVTLHAVQPADESLEHVFAYLVNR
ncbi:MAG TPA: ABC transporter ATP-binding protein [Gemmatimonas aurantiaca]|uniref:ABC transporter ATP-binding protein n=2 Tax=Gemmatimonas aurantiaca TaxID=173480 RepID=A0A3D4V5Y5_9BACT|nr:ABC transporter ATP-binding protein [Gemmatimonas aurantiaca]BAH37312.1 putative ABC transporter ATP-binding protein [Gemmatimonas aurantiaca T-27]HCT55727.1 ABC transporter ATP-binding protein [Gemmatimonas aurantiaca]